MDEDPPFVAGRPLVRDALHWAAALHHGQHRDVDQAPFVLHPAEVAAALSVRGYDDEVLVAGIPVGIGGDRAVRPDRVAKRRNQGVRPAEQPPDAADGGMHHHHVAGPEAEAPKILGQRTARVKRFRHRPSGAGLYRAGRPAAASTAGSGTTRPCGRQ